MPLLASIDFVHTSLFDHEWFCCATLIGGVYSGAYLADCFGKYIALCEVCEICIWSICFHPIVITTLKFVISVMGFYVTGNYSDDTYEQVYK